MKQMSDRAEARMFLACYLMAAAGLALRVTELLGWWS